MLSSLDVLQPARFGCLKDSSLKPSIHRHMCLRKCANTHIQSSLGFAGSQDAHQTVAAKLRRKVAIFVEPSPFSHVSGMKNRFECLIQGLRGKSMCDFQFAASAAVNSLSITTELGDDVTVVTPDVNPPKHYFGARVRRRMIVHVLFAQLLMDYCRHGMQTFGTEGKCTLASCCRL